MSERKPHRGFCSLCHDVMRIHYLVPAAVWAAALHISQQESMVCVRCFTAAADERGVAWDEDIQFFPRSRVTHDAMVRSYAAPGDGHPGTEDVPDA